MLHIRPFTPADALLIKPHAEHRIGLVESEQAALLGNDYALTAVDADGRIIMCAGAVMIWRNRAFLWALLSDLSGAHMLELTRMGFQLLPTIRASRLEAIVRQDFDAGHRWLQLLGFQNETPDGMRHFCGGDTFSLYARHQEGLDG
jgi:hypothetical protein